MNSTVQMVIDRVGYSHLDAFLQSLLRDLECRKHISSVVLTSGIRHNLERLGKLIESDPSDQLTLVKANAEAMLWTSKKGTPSRTTILRLFPSILPSNLNDDPLRKVTRKKVKSKHGSVRLHPLFPAVLEWLKKAFEPDPGSTTVTRRDEYGVVLRRYCLQDEGLARLPAGVSPGLQVPSW
jgi:hypothetical protein